MGKELVDRRPTIKGTIVDAEPGKRVWAIWTRTFGDTPGNNVLHILRLVVENENDFETHAGTNTSGPSKAVDTQQVLAVAAVLQRARKEAADWEMTGVEVWNPSVLVEAAAQKVMPGVDLMHREEGSVSSLMWYDENVDAAKDVVWVGNEKYAWC